MQTFCKCPLNLHVLHFKLFLFTQQLFAKWLLFLHCKHKVFKPSSSKSIQYYLNFFFWFDIVCFWCAFWILNEVFRLFEWQLILDSFFMSSGLDLFVFGDFNNSWLFIFEASSGIALLTKSLKITNSGCNICSLIKLS